MGKHVQNPAVEALNMNSQKITSLANGTASGDAVNYGQLSGMVTGTGAANRIALWSGSGTQTSNAAFTWLISGDDNRLTINGARSDVYGKSFQINSSAAVENFSVTDNGGVYLKGGIFQGKAQGGYYSLPANNLSLFTQYVALESGWMAVDATPTTGDKFRFFGAVVASSDRMAITSIYGANNGIGGSAGGVYTEIISFKADGSVGFKTSSPTATADINGTFRVRSLTTANNLLQHDGSGNVNSVSPFNYSGTLTANRTMTLGSYSFTLDASGAASSPATMLILKGKETSFSTRFIDYQNESGTTSFRMSATSSQVTLAALNSHDLRIEGVNSVNITNNLDRGFLVMSSGAVAFHSGLSTAPSSPATASMWWLSDRLQIKRSAAVANIATVEDDLMGEATQVITASTHTLTGQYYLTRYSASSNAVVVTLGDDLLEGHNYRVRCTGNGTNTVTFNAGGSNIFYVRGKSTITLTTLVCGAGGTGIEEANGIITIVRRENVIWIF